MLAEFGGSQLSLSAQQAVASTATSLLAQRQDSSINAQAALGATQSAVTDANSSMNAQLTLLQKQVNNLDNVDPNATAAESRASPTRLRWPTSSPRGSSS